MEDSIYTPEQRAWCEEYQRQTTFEALMDDFEAGNETFIVAAKKSTAWFLRWAVETHAAVQAPLVNGTLDQPEP